MSSEVIVIQCILSEAQREMTDIVQRDIKNKSRAERFKLYLTYILWCSNELLHSVHRWIIISSKDIKYKKIYIYQLDMTCFSISGNKAFTYLCSFTFFLKRSEFSIGCLPGTKGIIIKHGYNWNIVNVLGKLTGRSSSQNSSKTAIRHVIIYCIVLYQVTNQNHYNDWWYWSQTDLEHQVASGILQWLSSF